MSDLASVLESLESLLLKAKAALQNFDLFDSPVTVSGYTTPSGTFVAPHASHRKKKLEAPSHLAHLTPDHSLGKRYGTKLKNLIEKHGGLKAVLSMLANEPEANRQRMIQGFASVAIKPASDIAYLLHQDAEHLGIDLSEKEETPKLDKLQESIEAIKTPMPDQTGWTDAAKNNYKLWLDFNKDRTKLSKDKDFLEKLHAAAAQTSEDDDEAVFNLNLIGNAIYGTSYDSSKPNFRFKSEQNNSDEAPLIPQEHKQSGKTDLDGVINAATTPGRDGNKVYHIYRKVGDEEAEKIKQLSGIDVAGFEHGIDEAAVRHILRQHGDAKIEHARGQIAITPEDFKRLPDLTNAVKADSVEYGKKTPDGLLDTIIYKTRVNGFFVVVEEVRTKRNRLALKTMWKIRAVPNAPAMLQSPAKASETSGAQSSNGIESIATTGEGAKPPAPDAKKVLADQLESDMKAGNMPVFDVNKIHIAIHPSSKNPGMLQASRYDETGILGDSQYKTMEDAVRHEFLHTGKRLDAQEATRVLTASIASEQETQVKRAQYEASKNVKTFEATHELADGTLVRATDEPHTWVDADGNEIESTYAHSLAVTPHKKLDELSGHIEELKKPQAPIEKPKAKETPPSEKPADKPVVVFKPARQSAANTMPAKDFYGEGTEAEKRKSNKEIAGLMREDIKKGIAAGRIPKGVKVSIRSDHNSIDLRVTAVPEGLQVKNPDRMISDANREFASEFSVPYYSVDMKKIMEDLKAIHGKYNWDKSDLQTDYFHVNYYGHPSVDFSLENTVKVPSPESAKLGDTITVGGNTYILQGEPPRWHKVGSQQAQVKPETPKGRTADAKVIANLAERGNKLIAEAQADMNRDRLANTPKRVRQAGYAFDEASKKQRNGQTLVNISESLGRGDTPKLAGIRSVKDIEAIEQALRWGLNARDRYEDKSYADQEKEKGRAFDAQDVAHASIPPDETLRFQKLGVDHSSELPALLNEYLTIRAGQPKPDPVKEAEMALVGQKVGVDFFPTPKSLAHRMADLADIKPGMRVLEPSAGNGNLADAAQQAGGVVDAVEVSPTLQNILKLKKHAVVGQDFEDYQDAGDGYDRVIMNPPFSDRKDAAHIQRAYDMLKPGGKLVAIAGEGVFFGSDKKAVAFRDWLDAKGATVEKLPAGTFTDKTLPSTTGVNARLVVVTKPYASKIDELSSHVEALKELAQPAVESGVYRVGDKAYFKGDELTITSAPYALHGGEWQDGVTESGKRVTVPTPRQLDKNAVTKQQEFENQQAEFRRLKDSSVKDAALDAAITHLKEDSKQADIPAKERAEDKALVEKMEAARDEKPNEADYSTAQEYLAALQDWRKRTGNANAYETRQAERAERLQDRADAMQQEANRRLDAARKISDAIPFGQPILVGHHSEGKHRRDAARIENNMRSGFEAMSQADELARRATSAASNTAISSDDEDSVVKLQAKVEGLREAHERMVAINRIVRSKRLSDSNKLEKLRDLGMDGDEAVTVLRPEPAYSGHKPNPGFAAYQLQNSSANIRRIEERITHLKAAQEKAATQADQNGISGHTDFEGGYIEKNHDDNRIRIVFEKKPSADKIAELKSKGFRWSPSNGAWQRQISNSAEWHAEQIAGVKMQKSSPLLLFYRVVSENRALDFGV